MKLFNLMFPIYFNDEGGGSSTGNEGNTGDDINNNDDNTNDNDDDTNNDNTGDDNTNINDGDIDTKDKDEPTLELNPYDDLFTSPEEAQEVKTKAAQFDQLATIIMAGSSTELLKELSSSDDSEALTRFATNFLPSLARLDPDTYHLATAPVLSGILRRAAEEADMHDNKNLKAAVLLMTKFIFKRNEIPNFKPLDVKEYKNAKTNDKQDEFWAAKSKEFSNDTITNIESTAAETIESKLDKQKYPNKLSREAIVDKLFKVIREDLGKDIKHVFLMNTLWQRANKEGLTLSAQRKIVNQFNQAVLLRLPKALARLEGNNSNNNNRREGGQGNSNNRNGQIDPSRIDATKTSMRDVLDGKITFKK